jgi:hypothetical protein
MLANPNGVELREGSKKICRNFVRPSSGSSITDPTGRVNR